MIILSLDVATKTGWALMSSGNVLESGVEDFSRKRGESSGMMFLRFRKWLEFVLKWPVEFDLVVYEQSHFRGGAATEICVNLTGRVQECCAEHGIEYATVHTATLKKWATGHGKASKEDMIKRAKEILKRDPIDDNEADAVLIGAWATQEYGG